MSVAYILNYNSSDSVVHKKEMTHFYPAALKGSGVLSYPERAAGGRADKPR